MSERACGLLFDGYPRTINQAEQLVPIFNECGLSLDAVISLVIDPEEVIQRITSRRTCSNCGAILNLLDVSVAKARICPICNIGTLMQRDDDREDVFRTRIEQYHAVTAPLIDYYRERGTLHEIDAQGDIEVVGRRLVELIQRIWRTKQAAH